MKRLGVYYREKILSRDDLKEVTIAPFEGVATIEPCLFGWRVHAGRSVVDCASEEEARYLKVFFDATLPHVMVPQDEEFLKSILPELEKLKAKHDRIIQEDMEQFLSRRLRKVFYQGIWNKLLYEEPKT